MSNMFSTIPFQRSLFVQVGFADPVYKQLKQTFGYSWLYPQAFDIDPNTGQIFILRMTAGGQNAWGWIAVYHPNGSLDRYFTLKQKWTEGIVIVYDGSTRYLYTIGDGGTIVRKDITTLPPPTATVLPDDTFSNLGAYSFLAHDPNWSQWMIQTRAWVRGYDRRQYFKLLSHDFSEIGSYNYSYSQIGPIEPATIKLFPKPQGIGIKAGHLVVGYGGAYVPSANPGKANCWLQGVRVFTFDGVEVMNGLCDPDGFIENLSTMLGYTPTAIENEGVSVPDDVYALWVTRGPDDRESEANYGTGIAITQEFQSESAVDFSSAAQTSRTHFDENRFQLTVHAAATQIVSPFTGVPIDSFESIIEMMKLGNLSQFHFYGTNQQLADLSGQKIHVGGSVVSCYNPNGFTFFFQIRGNGVSYEYNVYTGENGYVQRANSLQVGSPPVSPDDDLRGELVSNRSGDTAVSDHVVIRRKHPNSNAMTYVGGVKSGNLHNDQTVIYHLTPGRWLAAGRGSPEGVITAAPGCFYIDVQVGDFYGKKGGGATGWKKTTLSELDGSLASERSGDTAVSDHVVIRRKHPNSNAMTYVGGIKSGNVHSDQTVIYHLTPLRWIAAGRGSPESVIAAEPGCFYINVQDGDFYGKTSGNDATGWKKFILS